MLVLAGDGATQAPDPFAGVTGSSQTGQERDQVLVKLLGSSVWLNAPGVDVQIAQWLRQVRQGRMAAPEFFKRLGAAGAGMKHVDAVKTKIEATGGSADFLGPAFSEGGTPVERSLLTWRRAQTEASIKESLRSVTHNTTVFVGLAGKWPTQQPNALTFSGDIDFSYVTADPQLSLKLKQRFEADFRERTGMAASADGADVVATAHGRADLDVYVARHGQAFAERTMTGLQRADASGGLTPVDRDAAFERIVVEGDLIGPTAIRRVERFDTEPGLSMEMVRHYVGDVARTDRFSLRDQVVKAAKYLDRAMKSAGVPAGGEDLATFAAEITQLANRADIKGLGRRIGDHFGDAISVAMVDGKLVVEMDAAQLAAFQREIAATIWDGARAQLERRVTDLQARFAAAEVLAPAERERAIDDIRPDYLALVDMMKAELLALSHDRVDVPKPIRDLDARLAALGRVLTAFGRGLTEDELVEKEALKKLIQSKSAVAHRFAIGRIVQLSWSTVERANHVLDYLDSYLLDDLRRYPEISDLVTEVKSARGDLHSGEPSRIEAARERIRAGGSKAAAVIRSVNIAINNDIQGFAAARGATKLVMVTGLVDEYMAYRATLARGDWNGLATEFFRRRVPFFSAVENAAMGNEVLAAVDIVTTLVPHIALVRAVEGIAETVNTWAIEYYWSQELRQFVDGLYLSARFTLVDIRTYGQAKVGEWRLATVTVDGTTYNLGKPPAGKRSYLALKRAQIRTMYQELKVRRANRLLYRDLEYGLFDNNRVEWILRKNLAKTDPFLVLYEELQHRPDVGASLRDHFQDMWLTRWEEVKLAYVFNLIKELEDRRQAEQGIGDLPDLFAQLVEIARDLDVMAPMRKAMAEEWSTGWTNSLLAWLWDFESELLSSPEITPERTKASEIVLRYLRDYRSIQTARNVVERDVMRGKPTDDGLRLLTGARFLSGKREVDVKTAQAWSERITTMNRNVNAELLAIKTRHADPKGPKPTLNTPFDETARMDVLREDVWRAAWTFVGSDASPVQQEIGRSRASVHKQRRDELVKLFDAHYAKAAKPAPPPQTPAPEPSKPKDFFEEVLGVIDRIEKDKTPTKAESAAPGDDKKVADCIARSPEVKSYRDNAAWAKRAATDPNASAKFNCGTGAGWQLWAPDACCEAFQRNKNAPGAWQQFQLCGWRDYLPRSQQAHDEAVRRCKAEAAAKPATR